VLKISSAYWNRLEEFLSCLLGYHIRDGVVVYGMIFNLLTQAWKSNEIHRIASDYLFANPARRDLIHSGLALFWKGRWAHRVKPYRRHGDGKVMEVIRHTIEQPWFISPIFSSANKSGPPLELRQSLAQTSLRPNRRKCALVYHQLVSGRLSGAVATFLNFDCIEAHFLAGSHHDLILMFDLVLRLHGAQMLEMDDGEEEDEVTTSQDDLRVSVTPRRIASIVLSQMPGVLKHFSKWDILGIFLSNNISRLSQFHQHSSHIPIATQHPFAATCGKPTNPFERFVNCTAHPFYKCKGG
jgi:hypothetical protein